MPRIAPMPLAPPMPPVPLIIATHATRGSHATRGTSPLVPPHGPHWPWGESSSEGNGFHEMT